MKPLVLALALVAYNNLLNLWPQFHGRLYVPLNLTLSAVSFGLATVAWSLNPRALGLGPGQGWDLLLGIFLGALAASPLFLALRNRKAAAKVADDRMAGFSPGELIYRTLLRVPLGTALPEELLFRGVLLAVLAPQGHPAAAVWSSFAFGLWHIVPARNLLLQSRVLGERSGPATIALLAGVVVVTAAAGLALVWLRLVTGGLAAPFGLHATLNSLGTVAAHLADKRTASPAGP